VRSLLNLRPASVGGFVPGSKMSCAMQALPKLRPHAAQLRIRTSLRRFWWLPPLRWMLYPGGAAYVLWLRGKLHSELPCLCKVEGSAGALAKGAPERSRKSVATGQPNAPTAQRVGPSIEQRNLGDGWNHVVQGGVSLRLRQTHPKTHTLNHSSSGHEGAREALSDSLQADSQA